MTDLTQVVIELRTKAEQFTQAANTLAELNGTEVKAAPVAGKRIVSAQARRKMRLAQKARWQRIKAERRMKPKLITRKAA